MKTRVILLFLVMFMLNMTSCIQPKNNSDVPLNVDSVTIKSDPGLVYSMLPEINKVTECEFVQEGNNYVLTPLICSNGDTVYVYKNPVFTSEVAAMPQAEADQYFNDYFENNTDNYTYKLEKYDSAEQSEPAETIILSGLSGQRINFSSLQFDSSENSFVMTGTEYYEENWCLFYYKFDSEGTLLKRIPMEAVPSTAELVIAADFVYYLEYHTMNRNGTEEYTIVKYDPSGKQAETLDILNTVALFETDSVVYCITQRYDNAGFPAGFALYSLNGSESTLLEEFDQIDSTIKTAEYDAGKRILYYSDYYSVNTLYFDDQILRPILVSGDKHILIQNISDTEIFVLNGNYAVTAYDRTVEKVSFSETQTTLRFCRYQNEAVYDLHEDVFRIMNANGVSARGEAYILDDASEYHYAIAKKLLAGDDDFDIFYVSTEMSELMDVRYYEDLSKYKITDSYYQKMLPGVINICSIDEVPCLIPIGLTTWCMQVNLECIADASVIDGWNLLSDLNHNIGVIDSAYLMADNSLYSIYSPFIKLLISNFMNGNIDDEQAREDLEILFDMAASAETNEAVYIGNDFRLKPALVKVSQNIGREKGLPDNETAIPILGVSENYQPAWEGGFYAVNPNSPNKEIAAIFLACYMERQINIGFGSAQLFEESESAGTIPLPRGSERMYDLYKKQLETGIRGYQIPNFTTIMMDLFDRLSSGELTAADASDEFFRHLKMLKYE